MNEKSGTGKNWNDGRRRGRIGIKPLRRNETGKEKKERSGNRKGSEKRRLTEKGVKKRKQIDWKRNEKTGTKKSRKD